jgi:hypothetical protein
MVVACDGIKKVDIELTLGGFDFSLANQNLAVTYSFTGLKWAVTFSPRKLHRSQSTEDFPNSPKRALDYPSRSGFVASRDWKHSHLENSDLS